MTKQLIKKIKRYHIISFDVFDTLIERTVAIPSDIFVGVGKTVFGSDNDFAKNRIQAEQIARSLSDSGEVTLSEIYEQLKSLYGNMTNVLMNEEIAQEINSCVPKSSMIDVYKSAIDTADKVFIISDMYLPSSVIEQMINECGISGYSKIYVSNEYNCNKISGKLYEKVIFENNIERQDMLHIGDSIKADFIGARKCKIDSCLIRRKNRFMRFIHG